MRMTLECEAAKFFFYLLPTKIMIGDLTWPDVNDQFSNEKYRT